MSVKEIDRVPIIKKLSEGKIVAVKASHCLGLSVRHVRRLKKLFVVKGAKGLVHKSRGKVSGRKISESEIKRIMKIVKDKYWDFGPTLALEKLTENHKVTVSRETLRKAMVSEGVWKAKKRKLVRIYQQRERRPREGELVQADGSPHAWFEKRGPNCTLLVFIDDATGKIMKGHFAKTETTDAYFEAMEGYVKEHGKPVALYVDKNSIFSVNNNFVNPAKPTQFKRAMDELIIEVILANSPQAKGRVERVNGTLQDRLVKEMRLKEISTIEEANRFLPKFIDDFNNKFAVKPKNKGDAHRPLLPSENLQKILVKKHQRTLSKNLEFQFENKLYQIQTKRPTYAMRNAAILITQNHKGKVKVYYKEKELEYKVIQKRPRQQETSAKELNFKVDELVKISQNQTMENMARKPAKDHPWRYMSI